MRRTGRATSQGKSERESLIEAALHWASAGVPVFPCGPDKRPLTSHSFQDATDDPALIKQMFDRDDVLIGARMGKASGLFAIDFDLYKRTGAKQFMDELAAEQLLVETRTHRTMRGGVHLIYSSDSIWPNVNPCDGVEVKGEGGYIIVPPSNGYTVLREGVEEAPPSLIQKLIHYRNAQSDASVAAITQAIINASNFHDSLTRLAAKLSGAGWKPGAVMQELRNALQGSVASNPEHERHARWNDLMKDKNGELSRIIASGHGKFNSFAVGEDAEELNLASEQLREVAAKVGFIPPPAGKHEETEPTAIGDFVGWPFEGEGYFAHTDYDLLSQRFIMHPILCEEESVLVSAEPKTGKTAVCLNVGLHVACGIDLGQSLKVAEPRSVLYFGLEGKRAIRLRIAAWRKYQEQQEIKLPEHIPLFVV